jgi:hypothetical protein
MGIENKFRIQGPRPSQIKGPRLHEPKRPQRRVKYGISLLLETHEVLSKKNSLPRFYRIWILFISLHLVIK